MLPKLQRHVFLRLVDSDFKKRELTEITPTVNINLGRLNFLTKAIIIVNTLPGADTILCRNLTVSLSYEIVCYRRTYPSREDPSPVTL